jgi:hypothetical protein
MRQLYLAPSFSSRDDKKYAQYLELMKLLQIPEIEGIILANFFDCMK